MFRKLFLPVGMLMALVVSFVFPAPGIAIKELNCNPWLIVAIFFVCGWNIEAGQMKFDRKFAAAFICGGIVSLMAAPLAGSGLSKLFGLQALAAAGLIAAMAVPPTLSSGIVMTESAGGNSLFAILMTIGYNLAGVVTMPLMLAFCISSSGEVKAEPVKMFTELVLLVLLPSIIGFLLKKFTGRKLPSWAGYVPSVAVILLILGFFSKSREHFISHPVSMLLLEGSCALILHLLLLGAMWSCGKLLKVGDPECKAMLFTGASKTITIALTMLEIMEAGTGEAMVPCLVYYFVQSVFDALLAGKMGLSANNKKQMA